MLHFGSAATLTSSTRTSFIRGKKLEEYQSMERLRVRQGARPRWKTTPLTTLKIQCRKKPDGLGLSVVFRTSKGPIRQVTNPHQFQGRWERYLFSQTILATMR